VRKHIRLFEDYLTPSNTLPEQLNKIYEQILGTLPSTFFNHVFLYYVMQLGTCQLLRKHIASQLLFTCKLNAMPLYNTLQNVNQGILKDVQRYFDIQYKNQANQKLQATKKPKSSILPNATKDGSSGITISSTQHQGSLTYPSEHNPIFSELTQYLQTSGMHQPFEKIYVTPHYNPSSSNVTTNGVSSNYNLPHIAVTLFLFVLSCIDRFTLFHPLSSRKEEG